MNDVRKQLIAAARGGHKIFVTGDDGGKPFAASGKVVTVLPDTVVMVADKQWVSRFRIDAIQSVEAASASQQSTETP